MMLLCLDLNRSQQMALSSIVLHYATKCTDEPQEFHDIVEDNTTTTGELLALVTDVQSQYFSAMQSAVTVLALVRLIEKVERCGEDEARKRAAVMCAEIQIGREQAARGQVN